MSRGLLWWETALTFVTTAVASLGLTNIVPPHVSASLVIIVQSANAATVVYKTQKWTPPTGTTPPVGGNPKE